MILRLGHCELRVTDLEAARAFYGDVLGLVEAEREPGRVYLRGLEEFDLWTLALTESQDPGLAHMALRVDDRDDLDRLEHLHRELGVPVKRVAAGAEPGQGEALRVLTPDGYPLEVYHHMDQISPHVNGRVRLPMRNTHRGARTGPLRIDHVNLRTDRMGDTLAHWVDRLDFRISEYVERDGGVFAAWTRRKTGNHDVAFVAAENCSLHHVAYFIPDPAAVIGCADALADAGLQPSIEFGPGRHGLSNALFLYVRDPSGNRLELYTGDYLRDIDLEPIRWSWEDYDSAGRLWWSSQFPERFMETTALNPRWPE